LLVSIVIPVRGDAGPLRALLAQLAPHPAAEVIVSTTDAADESLMIVTTERTDVRWVHGAAGRGVQQNAGAALARGRWIWFLHADSRVPSSWLDVFAALDAEPDVVGGAFRFALDSEAWQARLWERGVALRVRLFGLPYGDQGIFVRRAVFERMGGFHPLPLMEDVDFVGRLKREGRFRALKEQLHTSARRWEAEGWWRRSGRNVGLLALYYVGVSPERLARLYEREVRAEKSER
jgi:rSAM/selenodomain-associated transferase 2